LDDNEDAKKHRRRRIEGIVSLVIIGVGFIGISALMLWPPSPSDPAEAYLEEEVSEADRAFYEAREAETDLSAHWYTYNSSQTECFETGGPAEKLDEFVGFIDRPTTNDFRDASGALTKVEVVNAQGDGTEVVWTFYRQRADCEREWITRTEDLADQYR